MKITGANLLRTLLERQGIRIIAGIPGGAILPFYDALHGSAIRHVLARHEQGAGFIAQGMARATGRAAVCLATSGPGATNASIGVHTAFQDSTPMVLFVGDVASDTRDREAFQEVNFLSFFGPSTRGMAKLVERIDDAQRIPEYVARAFATAMAGRPGPVVPIGDDRHILSGTKQGHEKTVGVRAYFIWQQDGCPEGRAVEHWFRAFHQHLRERAYFIWLSENCPEGRADAHWRQAVEFETYF